MSDTAVTLRLHGRLDIATDHGRLLDHKRVRLLEAIALHGSILRAAREVPLTYKAAWDAVAAMNLCAGQLVVARAGNGSGLTEHGRRLVTMYRLLAAELQSALDTMAAPAPRTDAGDDVVADSGFEIVRAQDIPRL